MPGTLGDGGRSQVQSIVGRPSPTESSSRLLNLVAHPRRVASVQVDRELAVADLAHDEVGLQPELRKRPRQLAWVGDERAPAFVAATRVAASPFPGLLAAEHDAAVGREPEGRVVRDLPRVAVEVAEDAGVAPVEGLGRLARDRRAVPARLAYHVLDLLARADVVGERDAAPARAVAGDPAVRRELVPPPENDDDAVCPEESGVLDVERNRPPERLVERLRPRVVGDAERDQRDALLHATPSPRPSDLIMLTPSFLICVTLPPGLDRRRRGSGSVDVNPTGEDRDGTDQRPAEAVPPRARHGTRRGAEGACDAAEA